MPNSSQNIRLLALGQSLIEHDLREHPYPGFKPLAESLKRADVCFSNFEGAIQKDADAAPTREGVYFHGAPPQVFDCLKEFSINLLSLANNHSFDLGADGIAATLLQARARGFVSAGTGANLANASAPAYVRGAAGAVALVAFASKIPDGSLATDDQPGVNALRLTPNRQLDPGDTRRILLAIQNARQSADLVIAYHHDHYWEPNWQATPGWKQKWARECIDAGATAYIGHGVPLLHGIEIYNHRPILYGLGNFIFHSRTPVGKYESAVWESVIADCVFGRDQVGEIKLQAITLNESGDAGEDFFKTRGRPTLAENARARSIFNRLGKLSEQFGTRIAVLPGYARVEL